MRRALLAAMLVCITAVAAACPAAPGPGWTPPSVLSIVIDQPVAAGSAFTVTVSAIDDEQVTTVGLRFEHPAGVALDDRRYDVLQPINCEPAEFAPATSVTVELTCTATPHTANGTWRVTASVGDGKAPMGYEGRSTVDLAVAGGSDDVARPSLDALVVEPMQVTVGTPIVVTVRVSDQSELYTAHPLQLIGAVGQQVTCEESSRTAPTPDQLEVMYICSAPTAAETLEMLLIVRDVVGNTLTITDGISVEAA